MKTNIPPVLITFAFVCFGLFPKAQAVVPPPDGGYPGGNTAEGQNALLSLTSGTYNTAVGFFSLSVDSTGSFNTANGAGALLSNTADENTAIGAGALLSNTEGSFNTANGAFALFSNTAGDFNTATGFQALFGNTTGSVNTATGYRALQDNTTGTNNTATGFLALANNTEGDANTANGYRALHDNTTGIQNTAIGYYAGHDVTGDNNVCIGANVFGAAGVDNTTWIKNVYDSVATARAVYVNANNKIGTLSSSRRYKQEIRPMAEASEAILALRPMTFRYKKDIDPKRSRSFGLIAEDVAKVEFGPDHLDGRANPKRCATRRSTPCCSTSSSKHVARLTRSKSKLRRLTEGTRAKKVSAQLAAASPSRGGLEASEPAPQVVNNP